MIAPNETVLSCSDRSILGLASGSQEDTRYPDIRSVERIYTPTITITGHSGTNMSSSINVASLQPRALARLIVKKYKGDKNSLTDINLISCEAGMLINGRCFAQDFLREMQRLKFNNLKVHAMTHPSSMKIHSMIVETSQKFYQDTAKQEMTVSSFCYKSYDDEKRDKQIESELNNSDGETRRQLLQERATIRIYTCTELRYHEALSLKQNTFSGPQQNPEAVMSKAVVDAISFLQSTYDQLEVIEKIGNYGFYIKDVIKKLQENPADSLDDINAILKKEVPSFTIDSKFSELRNDLNRRIESNKSSEVSKAIEFLENLREQHLQNKKPNESGRYLNFLDECLASLRKPEYRNLSIDGIDSLLRTKIPLMTGNKAKYDNIINKLKETVRQGIEQKTDSSKNEIKLASTYAPTPTQNASSDYSILAIFKSIYKAILSISYRKPSAEFQDKMKELEESIKNLNNNNNSSNRTDKKDKTKAVKDFLIREVNSYLDANTDTTTKKNEQKIQLMKLIKDYLVNPEIAGITKLNAINNYVDQNRSNTLWDKGFRSRVRLIKEEVDILTKALEENSEDKHESPKI